MRVLWLLLVGCAPLAAGCAADPCELEPSYGGGATDEVWTTLHDATNDATTDADSAVLESPRDGAVLKADGDAPEFAWSSPLKLALAAPRALSPQLVRPRRSLVDRISAILVPSAHAHLPPVTSDAYLLNVTWSGAECPVQAVTTELEGKLDATGWDLVKTIRAELTATVVSAYLEDGRITEGPFSSEPVHFTVE